MTPQDPIHVRPASPRDLPGIIDLAVSLVEHSVSPLREVSLEQVRAHRRRDLDALWQLVGTPAAGLFVAEDPAGRLLGHVVVMADRVESSTGQPQAWVFDLGVTPEAWGRGIGRRLMERAETFTRERGLTALGLGVTCSNRRALEMYVGMGFQEERKQLIKFLGSEVGGL